MSGAKVEGQTLQIVDEVKAALQSSGVVSDYTVAQALGVSRATVSKWRNGKGGMGDSTAMKAADITKADPLYYLLRVAAERSDSVAAQDVIGKALKAIETQGRVVVRHRMVRP